MKDGTIRKSIEGYIVKYEQKKELYRRLMKGNNQNDNNDTSRDISKK